MLQIKIALLLITLIITQVTSLLHKREQSWNIPAAESKVMHLKILSYYKHI